MRTFTIRSLMLGTVGAVGLALSVVLASAASGGRTAISQPTIAARNAGSGAAGSGKTVVVAPYHTGMSNGYLGIGTGLEAVWDGRDGHAFGGDITINSVDRGGAIATALSGGRGVLRASGGGAVLNRGTGEGADAGAQGGGDHANGG